MSADQPTLNSTVLAQFSIFFQLTQQKHLCPPLSSLGMIIVTRFSLAALNILKNYKRSKTQLQDSSWKLINEIMFHPFSELFTGWPSKHVSNISCQHSFTLFSLIQPLFICLTFSMSTLHQDSSAPHLTRILRIPHIKTKHLDIAHFPTLLFLSEILCLMKLDIFSQPLHLKLPWRLICSNPISAS